MKDKVKIKGELVIKEMVDGKVVREHKYSNLVTTVGLQHIANALSAVALDDPMSQMAIGSGSGQTASSTALATELDRQPMSKAQGVGGAANTVVYTSTMPAGSGTGSITEAGIFNAASGGDMLCYTDFSAINKTASVSLGMTWTLTVS